MNYKFTISDRIYGLPIKRICIARTYKEAAQILNFSEYHLKTYGFRNKNLELLNGIPEATSFVIVEKGGEGSYIFSENEMDTPLSVEYVEKVMKTWRETYPTPSDYWRKPKAERPTQPSFKAISFKAGQKITFPAPFDNIIAYFNSIEFEKDTPIISYFDENDNLCHLKGYDLLDCTHG